MISSRAHAVQRILLVLLAGFAFASGRSAAAEPADALPSDTAKYMQNYRFRLGKCHLGDVGYADSGDPRVVILEKFTDGTKRKVFDSYDISDFKKAKGTDYEFSVKGVPYELDIRLDPQSQIEIRLEDVDVARNDAQVVKEFKVERLRDKLAKRLEDPTTNSWLELSVIDHPGKYAVTLIHSLVAPEDFEHIGGQFTGPIPEIDWPDMILHPGKTIQAEVAKVSASIKSTLEKCEQRIVVKHNGKEVFRADGKTGLYTEWHKEFEIVWKPNDEIEVIFIDVDTLNNDEIMREKDNSASSIQLLQGPVHGGLKERSSILFSTQRLDGHVQGPNGSGK